MRVTLRVHRTSVSYELLQVSIARLRRDGAKYVARLLEDGGDVSQFVHDEGGGARGAWSVLL